MVKSKIHIDLPVCRPEYFSAVHNYSSASHGRPGADYIKHVESLLESKNIRIECRIPSYNADSEALSTATMPWT